MIVPLTGPEDLKGGGAAAGADAAQEAALGDATNREAVAREQAPHARSSQQKRSNQLTSCIVLLQGLCLQQSSHLCGDPPAG